MPASSDNAKRDALRAVEFFAGCTEHELTEIAGLAAERAVDPGVELCHEGEFDQEVFVVLDGEATAHVRGETVGTVGPGEVVGELAMLGDGRRQATLVARTPLRVLVLDPEEVDSVLAADPSAQRNLGPRATRPDGDQ